MRVKYSPDPCAKPLITDELKSPLVAFFAARGCFATAREDPVTAREARLRMFLTCFSSRLRRVLKRASGVVFSVSVKVSKWCRSREMVSSRASSMVDVKVVVKESVTVSLLG